MLKLFALLLLLPTVAICQDCAHNTDIDSLRKAVFTLNARLDIHEQNDLVDKLILNSAGAEFCTAGAFTIVAVMTSIVASAWYMEGDKVDGWAWYGNAAGILCTAGYFFHRGGTKMGWVGKGYYVVNDR